MAPEPRESTEPPWRAWHDESVPVRLGVSSCLLGQEVRFDGGHKRDRYLTDVLGAYVQWVPVCPEVESGMGIPRPTLRLVAADEDGPDRLVAPDRGTDHTGEMARFAESRVRALARLGLDGYVLKRDSPSCGLERVKVYPTSARGGAGRRVGVGHFARVLIARAPDLPLEEEGRLNDPVLRENFIERIFARNRWRVLAKRGLSRRRLVAFHEAHKMLLRAHDETGYRRLGRLVAALGQRPDREVFDDYAAGFQETLRHRATSRKHVNVMQHVLGYLKKALPPRQKQEVLGAIEDYRRGLVPLVVPVSLLRFLIEAHDVGYVRGQLYLEPHPKELMLRNHV